MKKETAVMIVLVIGVALSTYYPYHRNLKLPYHIDEWQHLAFVRYSFDEGYLPNVNPYLAEEIAHADLEPGFHSFLAVLFNLIGKKDFIVSFHGLPILSSVFMALTLILMLSKIGMNRWLQCFGVLLLIFLTSNVNFLGRHFFVPLSLAMPFLYLIFHSLFQLKETLRWKNVLLLGSLIMITGLIHPPSVVSIIPALIIYSLSEKGIRELMSGKNAMIFVTTGLLMIAIISLIIPTLLVKTISLFQFNAGWGKVEVTFFIPFLAGVVSTLLALIAYTRRNPTTLPFIVWNLSMLMITAFFNLSGFSLILPYPRAVMYGLVSMIPLSVLGLRQVSDKINMRFNKKTASVLIGVIILLCLFRPYPKQDTYSHYSQPVVSQDDYDALKSISGLKGEVIMTPIFMGSAVYPITGKKVTAIVPAQLGGGDTTQVDRFYNSDNCFTKDDVLLKLNPDIVYSREKIVCKRLSRVSSKSGFTYVLTDMDDTFPINR